MNEQNQKTKEKEINDKVEKIKKELIDLNNKDFKIFYYCPDMKNNPSGGIGVIYQHVKVLKELGYDAQILTEKNDYTQPEWLGDKYQGLPHLSLETTKLQVKPSDFLIIPEGFGNLMEQTKSISAKRIVFAQSWYYILNSLMPGARWSDYGIKDTITVCSTLKNYIETVFGPDNQKIKICKEYIDDDLFKPSTKPQKPFIAISSRDQMQGLNLIKHFYLKFPQYRWVSFKDMRKMTKEEFAEVLRECCLGVFIDKVAGFGTFPIECAKSGVPVIALIPEITPEFANDKNAIWTNELLSIPDLIGNYVRLWLEDGIPLELIEGSKELSKLYSEEQGKKEIKKTYEELVQERRSEFETFINSNREITQSLLEKTPYETVEEVK